MNLERLCKSAPGVGRSFDLTGCDYAPHKRSQRFLGIQPYYYFLAGFVRHLSLWKILEIGTSYGGSTMAMHLGCKKAALSPSRSAVRALGTGLQPLFENLGVAFLAYDGPCS